MLQADDIDQVHTELASAVQNSCYDNVVEAVAMACLDGLNECSDLRSLIWKACRPRVQHVLQKIHPSQIHPQDASYDTEPCPVVTQHTRVERRAAIVETSSASSSRVCLDGAAVASSS